MDVQQEITRTIFEIMDADSKPPIGSVKETVHLGDILLTLKRQDFIAFDLAFNALRRLMPNTGIDPAHAMRLAQSETADVFRFFYVPSQKWEKHIDSMTAAGGSGRKEK